MRLNVSQAARAAGVSRGTIYHRIKKGSLSSEKGDDGRTYIQIAELQRVFGSLVIDGVNDVQKPVSIEQSSVQEVEVLRVEVRMLGEQARKAEERELELRGQVQTMLDVLKAQTRLLQAPGQEDRRRRRWWLFG